MDTQVLATQLLLEDLVDLGNSYTTSKNLNLFYVIESQSSLLECLFNWSRYSREEPGSCILELLAFDGSVERDVVCKFSQLDHDLLVSTENIFQLSDFLQ